MQRMSSWYGVRDTRKICDMDFWGENVNRRGRKQQEAGEKLTARNFIICAAGEVLVMR
jgi:hypothetical protein